MGKNNLKIEREKNHKMEILRKLITNLSPSFEIQSIFLPEIESIALLILFWSSFS